MPQVGLVPFDLRMGSLLRRYGLQPCRHVLRLRRRAPLDHIGIEHHFGKYYVGVLDDHRSHDHGVIDADLHDGDLFDDEFFDHRTHDLSDLDNESLHCLWRLHVFRRLREERELPVRLRY